MDTANIADLAAAVSALRAEVAELRVLKDKAAIFELVNTYTRAIDRHDEAMIASVFHPDAIDNHGDFLGNVDQFIDWVNTGHSQIAEGHMHNVTSHTCEIDGDVAHAETYVIVVLRLADGEPVRVGGGRYLDRIERRNGEWRIALRRVIMDWRFRADSGPWVKGRRGYPAGTWDKTDLSYMRPLQLEPDQLAKLKTGGSGN
ncbi:MAG: nuclear transport factor 2 family protein [Devosia sp.]